MNLVKGVVDSEDIYRETLLENKILRVIKKEYVTKYLDTLAEIAELNDAYKKFHAQLVKCMKFGIYEDSTVGVKTAEVLRFNTSKPGDELNNLAEYVDRIKEGQNDVHYITGESIAMVSSPFEENLRRKDRVELHVADPMDEYAVHQFKESEGTKLNPTLKEGLNLGDDDEKKTLEEELKANLEPSTKLMKDVLGDKVEMVITSDRIVDSPCVLTTSEYGWSGKMERIMEAQALCDNSMTSHMVSKKTMEVNPTHSIVEELKKKSSPAARQQQHKSSKHQLTKQSTQQERGGERKKERNREGIRGRSEQEEERDQEGRKEEERKVEERGSEQVEREAMDWTVVTRSKRKQRRVQIFVKVNGSKAIPVEVSLTDDKVEDVVRQVQKDEDVYVTMQGKLLRRDEKLRSCGVTDGCTIQVTSRFRGGGRSKNKTAGEKKKKSPKKVEQKDRSTEEKNLPEVDTIAEMLERSFRTGAGGWSAEMLEAMMGMDDEQTERMLKMLRSHVSEELGCDPEMVIGGMKKFVQERKRRREVQREEEMAQQRQHEEAEAAHRQQRQQEEVAQRQWQQQEEGTGKAKEEQEKEVRTGRGNAGLVRGEDERCRGSEASGKGQGKGHEGKGEHGKKGGRGGKGARQKMPSEEDEEDGRVQVAPNTGAVGSHSRATTDPEEEGRKEEGGET